MKRHRFDPISFVFGSAFIAAAVVLSSGHIGLTIARLRWLGAAVLVALGVAVLVTSRGRSS